MATRALLLSGDEKTIQAATHVLKDLDFAFEHSSELLFGINKLAHEHFDVILVDCDEKESATAVFDCVRGSPLHQTSITIACSRDTGLVGARVASRRQALRTPACPSPVATMLGVS